MNKKKDILVIFCFMKCLRNIKRIILSHKIIAYARQFWMHDRDNNPFEIMWSTPESLQVTGIIHK